MEDKHTDGHRCSDHYIHFLYKQRRRRKRTEHRAYKYIYIPNKQHNIKPWHVHDVILDWSPWKKSSIWRHVVNNEATEDVLLYLTVILFCTDTVYLWSNFSIISFTLLSRYELLARDQSSACWCPLTPTCVGLQTIHPCSCLSVSPFHCDH